MEPLLARFYSEAFPRLEPLIGRRPAAPRVVEWAKGRGLQVVIATNPLFPRTAIEQRMAWGRVGVDLFDYELVTCYENSHATKSSPAYFREIVEYLGRQPGECLMVGDNWGWDVVCAGEAGIPSYWIASDGVRCLRSPWSKWWGGETSIVVPDCGERRIASKKAGRNGRIGGLCGMKVETLKRRLGGARHRG